MVFQLNPQVSADSIELVVAQIRPSAACTLDGAGKGRKRVVNVVILETVSEDTTVEAAIMGNEKIVTDECLHQGPCISKGWGMCNISHPDAMDGCKAGYDVHAIRWFEECIVLIDQLSFSNLYQGHCTGACTLVAGSLEVYGTEVHRIRHRQS